MGATDEQIEAEQKGWLVECEMAREAEMASRDQAGLPLATVESTSGEGYEVMPENADAFRVFMEVSGQWENPGMGGGRCTVPLTEIETAIRLLQIRDTQDCFRRVQIMIRSAREIALEQFKEAAKKHGQ